VEGGGRREERRTYRSVITGCAIPSLILCDACRVVIIDIILLWIDFPSQTEVSNQRNN
jgi:hypothetical protein